MIKVTETATCTQCGQFAARRRDTRCWLCAWQRDQASKFECLEPVDFIDDLELPPCDTDAGLTYRDLLNTLLSFYRKSMDGQAFLDIMDGVQTALYGLTKKPDFPERERREFRALNAFCAWHTRALRIVLNRQTGKTTV
jgi:hypothetical protein